MTHFHIQSHDADEGETWYWSNSLGWTTDRAARDIFDKDEKQRLRLPMSGFWVVDSPHLTIDA